jgi:hypothetical protein
MGHIRTYENNQFLGQKNKMMMTTTLASIGNQTTKVKRPREGGFYVTFFFWFLFVVGLFFSFTFLSSLKISFFHQEFGYYLQIMVNKRFLSQSEQFCHGLGFS